MRLTLINKCSEQKCILTICLSFFRVYCDHFIARKHMSHEEKLTYFLQKIQEEKPETENGWKTKLRFSPEAIYNLTCMLLTFPSKYEFNP